MGPHYNSEIKVLEKGLVPGIYITLDSEFCNWKHCPETPVDYYSKSDF